MTNTKRKVSVSLDAELVDELEASEEAVSAQVNDAIRNELVKRRRQRVLGEMLTELDEEHGPLDEEVIEHYMDQLR